MGIKSLNNTHKSQKSDLFKNYNGLILLNKSAGPTSFDVVRKLKNSFFFNKIGHSGTLDPFAEGLLILLINKSSKLSYHFLSMEKEYIATIRLGIKTDTWDITGNIAEEKMVGKISKKKLTDILRSMKGKYIQEIPSFSAKKKMGRHLYDYARKGIEVEAIKSEVTIYDLRLINFHSGKFCVKICCSAGTYIRSVANDIGEKLGCGAVLAELKRTKIGKFNLSDAISPDDLIKSCMGFKHKENLNEMPDRKCLIPIKEVADKKKTIYVYRKYLKMLANNYPLYGYMINIKKTRQKDINENDIFLIKSPGFNKCFLHKSVTAFSTGDILIGDKKLTKYISIENFN